MDNLMNILLGHILDGDKKGAKSKPKRNKGRPKSVDIEEETKKLAEEQELLKEKAQDQIEKIALKRLEESMRKEQDEINNKLYRYRHDAQRNLEEERRKYLINKEMELLTAPTKRMGWEIVDNNMNHLRASLNGVHVFDINRGLTTFSLRLIGEMLSRAVDAKVNKSYSSFNLYELKNKAEAILRNIESIEKRASK